MAAKRILEYLLTTQIWRLFKMDICKRVDRLCRCELGFGRRHSAFNNCFCLHTKRCSNCVASTMTSDFRWFEHKSSVHEPVLCNSIDDMDKAFAPGYVYSQARADDCVSGQPRSNRAGTESSVQLSNKTYRHIVRFLERACRGERASSRKHSDGRYGC